MIVNILRDAPPPFRGAEIHTLPNGLKLILKEDHTVPIVSLQIWARCGALNETPALAGISHGLEHMVFKGSERRSASDISNLIESQGGAMNAATQMETTHYYIDVPSFGWETALDVLSDVLIRPSFPKEELERERLVIIEEIQRRKDSPDCTLWDEFFSNVFKNTPYGVNIIGDEKTVSSITRENLNDYFHLHYVPSKLTLVAVGDFDKGAMMEALKKHFASLPHKPAPEDPKVNFSGDMPDIKRLHKHVEVSYIAAGLPVSGFENGSDLPALDLLADILGGGMSSRFYQSLREEKETVLSLSCEYMAFNQKGLFSFSFETSPEKANTAIKQLQDEIQNIRRNPFTKNELDRAKARTKSEWLMGSETPRGQASVLGNLGVLNHLEWITKYLSTIDALTIDDLMNIYQRSLENKKLAITTVEPIS